MSEEQGRRVGRNESIFRQVNEQIESLNHSFGTVISTMAVICECAAGDCTERIEIAVRAAGIPEMRHGDGRAGERDGDEDRGGDRGRAAGSRDARLDTRRHSDARRRVGILVAECHRVSAAHDDALVDLLDGQQIVTGM